MKPRLLDLFCGAGGCSVGYARAGFEVVGVDIELQPNYPFEFHEADAMAFPLGGFDCIHASPPCQSYSRAMRHLAAVKPKLIDAVRERLKASGRPWVIENVEGAPLPEQPDLEGRYGVVLCGTQFGKRLWRHRLFETNFPVPSMGCTHTGLPLNPNNELGRRRIKDEFGGGDVPDWPEVVWRREMGVEWMSRYEGREAVPPVMTEFIGLQLLAHIESQRELAA